MQLKTLLNFVEEHKGFVYDGFKLNRRRPRPTLLVRVRPAKGRKGICSRCRTPGPTYDTLHERRYQFVPLWGIAVFFLYAMRRISCGRCKRVIVEAVSWATGKQTITTSFAWFLAGWAQRMSWKEVARAFHVTWDTVFAAVKVAVEYGLAHRTLDDVEVLGVDEVMWQRCGRKFLTVVYALDEGRRRLLWIGQERTEAALRSFFDWFGGNARNLRAVASDMWQPFLNVIRERVPWALSVLDRFHIVAGVHRAVDEVRRSEAAELTRRGETVLKHKRWIFLKSPENLSEPQAAKLADLVKANLRTVRAYLLKEELRQLWDLFSPARACLFLTGWCRRARRSKLKPLARVAKTLEKKADLILNWFRAGGAISSGAVEGLNNKLKIIIRRAYGFRSYDVTSTALYHALGKLPEPPLIHRFH
ncbi:MAG: ISL3 family transposase [Myxococcales bacterium]|nr:ISL3 family transposase [Myxococcales bacterium]